MTNIIRDFPKKELVSILELIDDLSKCVTHTDAADLLMRVSNLLNADCAVCGTGIIDSKGTITINEILDSDYPEEWLNLYFREGLYRHDPIIRHHMKFSEPELWSNIREGITDEKARAVTAWAGEFGLKYGISSSLYIPATGMFSLFCFASSEDVFTERHKDLLGALILHLNIAISESSVKNPVGKKQRAVKAPFLQ